MSVATQVREVRSESPMSAEDYSADELVQTPPVSLDDFMPPNPPAAPAKVKADKNAGPYYGCRVKGQAGQINRCLFEAAGPLTAEEISKIVSARTPEYKCGAGRVEGHLTYWMAKKIQIGRVCVLKDGKYSLSS